MQDINQTITDDTPLAALSTKELTSKIEATIRRIDELYGAADSKPDTDAVH